MLVSKKVIAVAQIALSIIFLIGYFSIMAAFLGGYVMVAPVWRDQIGVLLGVLTGGVGTILAFWFARNRDSNNDSNSG